MADNLITGVTKNELINELLAMARSGLLPCADVLSPTRKYCIEQGYIEEVGRSENKKLIISPAGLEKLITMAAEVRDSERIKALELKLQDGVEDKLLNLLVTLKTVKDEDVHMLAHFRREAIAIHTLKQVQYLIAGKIEKL